MATNQENKDSIEGISNSERLLDLSNQLLNSYSERKKALGSIIAEERLYYNSLSQQQRLSQQIAANSDKYLGYLVKSKDLSRDIKATNDNINKSQNAYNGISKKINESREKAAKSETALLKNKQNIQDQINKLDLDGEILRDKIKKATNQSEIARLKEEIKENLRSASLQETNLTRVDKLINKQKSIKESADEIIKNQKETQEAQERELAFLQKNYEIRRRIEKSTGLVGAFSKSLAKIPGIGQYLDADEAIDEMEKLAASIEEGGGKATSFGNRAQIALKGISTLAKGFYENIKSPEAIFAFFINAALKANKESVNLSKNLGYGAANADRLRANFADIERSSDNLNVNTANLSEAFNQLSEATGFVTEYSADALVTQIKLTKQLGLTGDEAAGVYRFSVLTGQSSEATYQSMLRGYVATRNSLNVGVPFKAAMAEAAKVTGQLAANMGYNAENTIRGVVATKALGTSLEQAKSQGEKLLDFQSSIESELKAELITGQQLNLERARAAALMGDQVAVAEELAAQGMTAAKFSQMNTIAQKSFAEALGITSDELANQLAKREEAIASGKSLAQITAEEADEAARRQDVQTKFNAAMEKLQSIIGNLLAGPLGSFLEVLSGILNIVSSIMGAFGGIGGIVLGLIPIISSFSLILRAAAGRGIMGAIGAIFGSFAAIPYGLGIPLAIGAVAGLMSLVGSVTSSIKDGVVDPNKGPVMTGEFGTVQMNPKDKAMYGADGKIKVGTNLLGDDNGKITSIKSTPAMDITPMISAINQVTAAVTTLSNKSWDVKLDSKSVGAGLIQNSYRSA